MSSIALILRQDVQQYIKEHLNENVSALALRKTKIQDVPGIIILNQIAGRQKVESKIPLYYHTHDIVYPSQLNIEQSSSQATGLYKKNLLKSLFDQEKPILADLTGGFGVDTFFMSTFCKAITHVEPNKELQQIAKHNHTQLGACAIEYEATTAEEFLSKHSTFNLIYADPSRRKQTKRVYKLSESEPNIATLQKRIHQISNYLLLKASPMLDLRGAINELHYVKKVIVLSVENECKELLFLCERSYSEAPCVSAVNISKEGDVLEEFAFYYADEKKAIVAFSPPLTYLYEPNAAILKAGAFKSICSVYPVFKIQQHTHLYTSSHIVKNFPGKIFQIIRFIKPDAREIKHWVPDRKINVVVRNYPQQAEELKNKLKLTDGGTQYLVAFSSEHKKWVALCDRLR